MAEDSVDERTRARKAAYSRKYYRENLEKCREAARIRANARYKADPKKVGDEIRAYKKANPDKKREMDANWRANNREKLREVTRAWNASHPDERKKIAKKWVGENTDKMRIYARQRRAKKLSAEGSHTVADIAAIRKLQKDRCAMTCCRARLNGRGDVDHIQALSKGGSNWPRNLQILCMSCNRSKNDRDPIEFSQSRGMLL